MNELAHQIMLSFLAETKAKVLLSGYDNELYREALKNWNVDRTTTTDEAGRKRMEYLWANYDFPQDNTLFYGGGNDS
jgi:DNA adenine methylase